MSKDYMIKQLSQVFTYSELLARLLEFKELLDPKEGYLSEGRVYKQIEELEKEIRNGIEQHLSNSKVSMRAMTIINNTKVLNHTKAKDNG